MATIAITISGPPKSGKSILAKLIKASLEKKLDKLIPVYDESNTRIFRFDAVLPPLLFRNIAIRIEVKK